MAEHTCLNKVITIIEYLSIKFICNTFFYRLWQINIEQRDTFAQILGTAQKTFLLLIFGNLIQIEETYCTGYSKKRQPTTFTIIVLFYRYNENKRQFSDQPYPS